jgi:transposase
MTLYCGIDLHANNSVISVIDDHDAVVYEKRHANDLRKIEAVLEPFRENLLACVVESTYNCYWLASRWADGRGVRLVNRIRAQTNFPR